MEPPAKWRKCEANFDLSHWSDTGRSRKWPVPAKSAGWILYINNNNNNIEVAKESNICAAIRTFDLTEEMVKEYRRMKMF